MVRSLNRAELIGNLTRDPELRYTPSGAAVCSFSIATNRSWTTDTGEKHEETEFHNIVSWNKLAELCSQFLAKGRKVYVEGRLQTRKWSGQDGQQRSTTEIIISDMILLDNKGASQGTSSDEPSAGRKPASAPQPAKKQPAKHEEPAPEELPEPQEEDVAPDDIPF